MEEKTAQELIHKAIKDMVQWVRESPTEEVRQYRIRLIMSVVNGTMEPQGNAEFDFYRNTMNGEWDYSREEGK